MPIEPVVGAGYIVAVNSIAEQIDAGGAFTAAANVAVIATPATATAEDDANKINEVINALVAAGLMEAP